MRDQKSGMISVIIPCYNVEQCVKRCIDSVLNNTYRNLQVICLNDGSTDRTLDILNSYSDERIVVISHENKGLSGTRNVGIEKACGEFICFIDSDDWVHKEYFERLIQTQRETNAEITVCKYSIVNDYCDDAEISSFKYEKKRLFTAFDDTVLCDVAWCKLYNRDLIGEVRFVNVFSEDKLFNAAILMSHKDAVCAIVDIPLYYYFMRCGSAIHTYHEHCMRSIAEEFLMMSEKTSDIEVSDSFIERAFKIALSSRYMTMFRSDLLSYNKSCDEFLRGSLKRISHWPVSKRLLYTFFVKCPSLYRRYRKITDSSLSEWENKEYALDKTK